MRIAAIAAVVVALLFGAVLQTPAIAEESATAKAARDIITSQIEAFRRDDGTTAFSFAAPEVQLKFPTPEIFMKMVKLGYAPVYRPKSYEFADIIEANGLIQQNVDLTSSDGEYWVAEYILRPMPDGSMKISGCRLVKRQGIGA